MENNRIINFTATDERLVSACPGGYPSDSVAWIRAEFSLGSVVANDICAKYETIYFGNQSLWGTKDKVLCQVGGPSCIIIRDTAYSDAATFKAAMSGVYLVYELATATTEQANPYTNPQVVDDFGTEEYVTDSIVPVGHVTKYQPDLKAKLEMAPDSPEGDGDYIVRQTGGQNAYVTLSSNATIQDMLNRITALENA